MAGSNADTQHPVPAPAPGAAAAAGLRPWRDVVTPHPDVSTGRYLQAEFAADLAQVLAGKAALEYQDPVEFFQRTHLTDGLRRLLATALERVAGRGGEPVIQLKTAFGGGKTHAMLALYHLLGGRAEAAALDGIPGVLHTAGVAGVPHMRPAVLVGTDLSPAQPWPSPALGGRPVRTLWGEMAAQLGGGAGYALLRQEDEAGVPPGAAALVRLLESFGPAVILVDELVAFARTLYERRGLPAGSFDGNLTFVHSLTEAVRRSATSLLVLTIPTSDIELGGEAGAAAMERLAATTGRVESIWRPAAAEEGVQIVRRRLFLPPLDEAARDATCLAFSRMYADRGADFPAEAREVSYLDRLRAAYPIHPEVFDQLYNVWSALERFQRTRGVLRLMAAVVYQLWTRRDRSLLIVPGSLPLDAPRVREELTRHLDGGWSGVVDADVDGERSAASAIDDGNRRFGRSAAARRVARAIFLGSAPAAGRQPARGIEDVRVRLGVVQPGEPVALFDDALGRLRESLTYLHGDGRRLWFDARPNLNRTAADRAAGTEAWRVEAEIRRRLATRERADFAAVHVHEPGTEIPDAPAARLVVLPPSHAHAARPADGDASPAVQLAAQILEQRGGGPRQYRNMLLFLAADGGAVAALRQTIRQALAWASLEADAAGLNLDAFQQQQAGEAAGLSDGTADRQLHEAYCWLLVPFQEGTEPVRWEAIRVPGSDPCVARAARQLRRDELLITRWSPALLRRELDRWLWNGRPHVGVREVWEALARYCYLPRLKNAGVLAAAVAAGVGSREYFACADAVTDDGRYLGLRFGEAAAEVRLDSAAVVVRPEVAARQIEGQAGAGKQAASESGRGETTTAEPGTSRGPDAAEETSANHEPPRVRRFCGSVALDPLRLERDAGRIAAEIVRHLAGLVGAQADVTLEVEVRVPEGIPPELVRTLGENCRALRFRTADFEAD